MGIEATDDWTGDESGGESGGEDPAPGGSVLGEPTGSDADRGIVRESDTELDEGVAASRATGGDPDADGPDAEGTTGTGESGEFVGRVSGQDEGYAGLTGAEARAGQDDGSGGGALGDGT